MLNVIRELVTRYHRRALIEELNTIERSRVYMDWREEQVVKRILALDLKSTRNQIAAVRLRGY